MTRFRPFDPDFVLVSMTALNGEQPVELHTPVLITRDTEPDYTSVGIMWGWSCWTSEQPIHYEALVLDGKGVAWRLDLEHDEFRVLTADERALNESTLDRIAVAGRWPWRVK